MIKIGRFEPSSQICSNCGHRQKISLEDRVYKCPHCGNEIDRDTNAALNIRDFAIQKSLVKNLSTDGTSGINACGVGSSGNCGVSCNCETTDDETRKFSFIKKENHNHLQ